MFTIQVLRQGKPIPYGEYNGKDAYQNAKERMTDLLKMLAIGTVEIVAPGGFVIDRETANIFQTAK